MRIEDISRMAPWAQKQILEKLQKLDRKPEKTEPVKSASKNREAGKSEVTGSKYGNQKTVVGGIMFDSKKEAGRFLELAALLEAGEIFDLKLQQNFTLQESYTKPDGERVRGIVYRADFAYKRPGENGDTLYIVEDVKSSATKTRVYELKKKLMREKFGVEITEI